ncbi:MAG TPA: WD40 repeat domain-containing protein [Bacteroidia bacterium]
MKPSSFLVLSLLVFSAQISVCQSFKVKHTEHNANLESVVFSYDGKKMASGDWNGVINLYTLDSNKNFTFSKSIPGHYAAVTTLSFSKNGKFLVSSSKDFSIKVWNLDTAGKDKTFNLHTQNITAAFLDPSCKYLISSSTDGSVKTTSVHNIKKSREFKPGGPVTDVIITKDFKYYFVALKGGAIKKFEVAGKNLEQLALTGHADDVNSIELSPDEKTLASGSNDKTIIVWDLSNGKVKKKLIGFEWKVTSISFSSDGNYIIGGCNDGIVKLFEIETGKCLNDFKELGKNARDVAFLRDGSQVAVATHMEGEKFGAVIYNTGLSINVAPIGGTSTDSKGKGSKGTAPAATPKQVKKSNGSK